MLLECHHNKLLDLNPIKYTKPSVPGGVRATTFGEHVKFVILRFPTQMGCEGPVAPVASSSRIQQGICRHSLSNRKGVQ